MPTTITGNAATFNRGGVFSFTGPADSEGIDAVDVNSPFAFLADAVEDYRLYGAKRDAANTFSGANTHTLAAGESSAHVVFSEPTTRRFAMQLHLTGTTGAANIYHSTDYEIVLNATWDAGGSQWTQTDAAQVSTRYRFTRAGFLRIDYKGAGAGSWADGAWTASQLAFNAGTGTVDVAGGMTANGLVAGGTGVAAQTGDVIASAGNIEASAGNVIAAGTPVGDAGPGLVKSKRVYTTGTVVTSDRFANTANWGGAGPPALAFTPSATARDMAGDVTITAGSGCAANPIFTLTWKDGTFTTVPAAVIVGFRDTDDPAITVSNSSVSWTYGATTLVVTLNTGVTAPTAGKLFRFSWIAIGG